MQSRKKWVGPRPAAAEAPPAGATGPEPQSIVATEAPPAESAQAPLSEAQRTTAESLFQRYSAFALRIAEGWIRTRGVTGLDADGMRNAALWGLWEAALKFDVSKGARFTTYAIWIVKGRINDAARDLDFIPRLMRGRVNRGELEAPHVALLSNLMELQQGERLRPMGWKDPKANRPMELLEAKDLAARLMGKLYGPQRRVIEALYLEEKSMKAIGEELNLSESRISQLHQLAIEHLRRALGLPGGLPVSATQARGQRRLPRPDGP